MDYSKTPKPPTDKDLNISLGSLPPKPHEGVNHCCRRGPEVGVWSNHCQDIPSKCGYCAEPNEALKAANK